MSTLTPAHRRSASFIKVIQSLAATTDMPASTKRSMVSYARSIRWMVEASEPAMARELATDLNAAVQEEEAVGEGWKVIVKRRVDELLAVI